MDNFTQYIFKSVRNVAYLSHILGMDAEPHTPRGEAPRCPPAAPLSGATGFRVKF